MANLFDIRGSVQAGPELVDPLITTGEMTVERIVSWGHTTPPGEWYDQERDEWVLVARGEATLAYENGERQHLATGDYVLIPAHRRHRVEYTSSPCIWLAIHGALHHQNPGTI